MMHSRISATIRVVICTSFLASGSGSCLGAAEPLIDADAAEARLGRWRERVLLAPTAPVSGLRVPHDGTRVALRFEVSGDDLVERRSLRARDIEDSVSGRDQRHIGDDRSNVVRRDGLEQTGRNPDYVLLRA